MRIKKSLAWHPLAFGLGWLVAAIFFTPPLTTAEIVVAVIFLTAAAVIATFGRK